MQHLFNLLAGIALLLHLHAISELEDRVDALEQQEARQ
jgi:hypothetical protein